MQSGLGTNLQEDLLTLLCFDEKYARVIRHAADPFHFEGIYREVAERVYGYLDIYAEGVPGYALPTIFEDILEDKSNVRKGNTFRDVITSLEASKDHVNAEYAVSRLQTFIRGQTLKSSIIEAIDILETKEVPSDEMIAEATNIITAQQKQMLDVFDPGVRMTDLDKSLNFLDMQESGFPIGIEYFDRLKLGPARKRLHILIGLTGRGKTWWLVNLGKRALMRRQNVLHISLEMPWEEVLQRYFQSIFALAKRSDKYEQIKFKTNSMDRLEGFEWINARAELSMDDPKIKEKLTTLVNKHGLRLDSLIVKEFPSGTLSLQGLRAYLDSLEATGFIPDLILLDYIDNMHMDANKLRENLGRTTVELRGIAGERNVAIATVTQSNREGLKKRKLTEGNVAEDWSKMATADTVLTFNQTDEEAIMGLARLYVAKARSEASKSMVLISQSYGTGQFILEALPMYDHYWDHIINESNLQQGIDLDDIKED